MYFFEVMKLLRYRVGFVASVSSFDSRFYEENFITDFEIHYLAQCFEGEEIKIYKVEDGNRIILLGEKDGGKIAVQSILTRNIKQVRAQHRF